MLSGLRDVQANKTSLASPRNSTQSQKPNRAIIKRTGIEADEERNRRIAQHADEYEALIEDINNRSLLRNYIETRRRIWKQSIEKAQAKIEEIEAEKKELQRSIDGMEEAWMEFEGKYDWLGTKEYDLEVKEMFDLYFNLDVEVLSMENVKQGGAGDGPHGDEEDAGSVNGDGQDLGGAA